MELTITTRLVQDEMRFYKRAIRCYQAAGIGLDYAGWTLKASGSLLLLTVVKSDKNSFAAIYGADGLVVSIHRAGHCRVEVRGKGMKDKRKNTQQ